MAMGLLTPSGSQRRRIAVVNTEIQGGGAARIASGLAHFQRDLGHEITFFTRDKTTVLSPPFRSKPDVSQRALTLPKIFQLVRSAADRARGYKDFAYPRIPRQLSRTGPYDILHLHNLHGDFFDLRSLPLLSRTQPTLLTLHDMWLLTGHCAHSFSCDRWRIGCGACPDLSIYPSVWRDGTDYNWARKQNILNNSNVLVVAPAAWLATLVRASPIFANLRDRIRIIPNGIDIDRILPIDKAMARQTLGLPNKGIFIGIAAQGVVKNPFKDFATAIATIRTFASNYARSSTAPITVLVYGASQDKLPSDCFIRYIAIDPKGDLQSFYGSCDVFLHSAKAETDPLVLLEAIAACRPIVATAVGGIPERLSPYSEYSFQADVGDKEGLAMGLAKAINIAAISSAYRQDISLNKMAERYAIVYEEAIRNFQSISA